MYTPARPLLVPPPAAYPITDVTVSTPTSWMLTGYLEKDTGEMSLRAPTWVARGGRVTLRGEVSSVGNTTVRIYKRAAGKTSDTLIATAPAILNDRFQAHFAFRTRALKVDTRFTAVWDGDEASLGATASRLVRVRAR